MSNNRRGLISNIDENARLGEELNKDLELDQQPIVQNSKVKSGEKEIRFHNHRQTEDFAYTVAINYPFTGYSVDLDNYTVTVKANELNDYLQIKSNQIDPDQDSYPGVNLNSL